ncbi:hypothetical protein ACFPPD_01495 [Cohnella suwonensis]|uniref:Uncharacterized protein n=1 Tax=Cohnella suwonensis TaxID=696072 RepID=A0ABW0LQT0_9BACL
MNQRLPIPGGVRRAVQGGLHHEPVVQLRAIFGVTYFYPVFKVRVVQFGNDDLSDFYGNYNNVTAIVFREVLHRTFSGITIQCPAGYLLHKTLCSKRRTFRLIPVNREQQFD